MAGKNCQIFAKSNDPNGREETCFFKRFLKRLPGFSNQADIGVCLTTLFVLNPTFTILKHLVQYFFPLETCRLGFLKRFVIWARRGHFDAPEAPFLCLDQAILTEPLLHLVQIAIFSSKTMLEYYHKLI